MRFAATLFSLASVFLLSACSPSSTASGYSMYDKRYFEEPPRIVATRHPATYTLRWRYGTMGFYFRPVAEIRHGHLYFSLQGTTSSGSLSGQEGALPIIDSDMIRAIEDNGGAFWVEPDGAKVGLRMTGSAMICVFPCESHGH